MPLPVLKRLLLLFNVMFAMAVYAFLNFLFGRNPQHLTDVKLAYSFLALFFVFAYASSRFTGEFVIPLLSWIVWIGVGAIIVAASVMFFAFKLNAPLLELALATILFIAMILAGSSLGLWLNRRGRRRFSSSAERGKGA